MQCPNQGTRAHSKHLVRRQPHHGRCSLLKGNFLSKTMVSKRTPAPTSHKSPRDQSSQRRFVSGTTKRHCQDQFGFKDSIRLYQEAGRNSQFSFKPRGLSSLERSCVKKVDTCNPTLAVNQRQCNGRFPLPASVSSVGVPVIRRCLPTGSGQLPHQPNVGRLCLQGHQEADQVHELVSRSRSSSKGCSPAPLGSRILCFPSRSSNSEIASEDRKREDKGRDDIAKVAVSNMVDTCPESVVGSDPAPPQLQDCPDNGGQVQEPPLSGPIGGRSPSEQDLNSFLSNHLASGTHKGYNSCYRKFKSYCLAKNLNPTNCNPEDIARYIQHLFVSGSSYSSVNLARSAISKYHIGFNGTPAGQHKIVCNAVKAVFRLRPPLPKYKSTYDVSIVLEYLKSLPANPQLSMKMLTYKTLFLLTVATISRVSSISKLGPTLSVHQVSLYN